MLVIFMRLVQIFSSADILRDIIGACVIGPDASQFYHLPILSKFKMPIAKNHIPHEDIIFDNMPMTAKIDLLR